MIGISQIIQYVDDTILIVPAVDYQLVGLKEMLHFFSLLQLA